MLDHFGYKNAHDTILHSIENILSKKEFTTKDLGGSASTKECGDAIEANI